MKVFGVSVACVACATSLSLGQATAPVQGELLSAFSGLDNSLRIRIATARTCAGIPGGDGMPVIFSHEVDPATLDVADIRVRRSSGADGRVDCLTLRPADEPGELRTALLIGEFGSADDPAVSVEITGDVASLDGSLNFLGARVEVTPLSAGPTLVLAEVLAPEAWSLDATGDCPGDGVRAIVRATWAGGVRRPGGDEIDAREMALYRVTLVQADGTRIAVPPLAIGDLGDNDNNHDLCLGIAGTPISVFFPAGALVDPNGDLNPDTQIAVSAPPAE